MRCKNIRDHFRAVVLNATRHTPAVMAVFSLTRQREICLENPGFDLSKLSTHTYSIHGCWPPPTMSGRTQRIVFTLLIASRGVEQSVGVLVVWWTGRACLFVSRVVSFGLRCVACGSRVRRSWSGSSHASLSGASFSQTDFACLRKPCGVPPLDLFFGPSSRCCRGVRPDSVVLLCFSLCHKPERHVKDNFLSDRAKWMVSRPMRLRCAVVWCATSLNLDVSRCLSDAVGLLIIGSVSPDPAAVALTRGTSMAGTVHCKQLFVANQMCATWSVVLLAQSLRTICEAHTHVFHGRAPSA